jgi:SAM-dependent methyltransferase
MSEVVRAMTTGLFNRPLPVVRGVHVAGEAHFSTDEVQTSAAFSEKWNALEQDKLDDDEAWKTSQFRWYLECYGYANEAAFAAALRRTNLILDAGCGPGYKAAWLARLAPHAKVVGMDLSESIFIAAERYANVSNLILVRGDIADTPFGDSVFDLVSCDQVLHHTESPPDTLREFARILAPGGSLNTYVYAQKALPRELLDQHFRTASKTLSQEQLWELSDQLTLLGQVLSGLNVTIDVPHMPLLGIKGGQQDLQRFVYWNFLKCFWNENFGFEASKMVNFDWYAPSTAFRYTFDEFNAMVAAAGFRADFVHSEEACHTGRFTR